MEAISPQVEVSNLLRPLINTFRRLGDEWNNFFDIGLSEYLHNQTDKFYFTNTFIHRSEKVRFNEIYYPLKATYKNLNTDFLSLESLFQEYNKITLVGSAGSGKTTLLKHIFFQTIKEGKKIPLLVELRHLNEFEGDLEKLIAGRALKNNIVPNEEIFIRTLLKGKFIFLFDGYDEIFSSRKRQINIQLEAFVDAYSKNSFLISTRPGSGIEGFASFFDFKVCALTKDDVAGFINQVVNEPERRQRILDIINDKKNVEYLQYLKNPLLLSMFILAFESHPEIPTRKSAFYRNVFDTLYAKHDGITKNSFPREKATKLQSDDFQTVLGVFCFDTLNEGIYTFTYEYLVDKLNQIRKFTEVEFVSEDLIYDLQTSISIFVLDGFEYSFPHRSLQEYFSAKFISALDTSMKEQVYGRFPENFYFSTDPGYHYWGLCRELDETAFTKYFLIPQLVNQRNKLRGKTPSTLTKSFVRLLNPAFAYAEEGSASELHILRFGSLFSALMDFCEVYNYETVWLFPRTHGCAKKLLDAKTKNITLKERLREHKLADFNDTSVYIDILVEAGFGEVVHGIRSALSEKINFLKRHIEARSKMINSFLGSTRAVR